MPLVDFAILSFGSIFAIVDPIMTVPAFLAMTERNTFEERVRMARVASLVAFTVLLIFALVGQAFLKIFGVSVPAFEIAGGVVLLKISLDMLQARRTALKETPEEEEEALHKEDVAVTPLGVPMLAGPGAMTAVILLSGQSDWPARMVLVGNIFLVSVISFGVLRVAAHRPAFLSGITLKIITRLMGLFLAAIAVQFILNGVEALQK